MTTFKKIFATLSGVIKSKPGFFILLTIPLGLFLLYYDIRYFMSFSNGWDYFNNIVVEAHGFFIDLLVLGVVFSLYEANRERQERINQRLVEIDGYRGWDDKEASYKTANLIRLLNSEDESRLNLTRCYLAGANLSKVSLPESNLSGANFYDTDLTNANLNGANFFHAYLFKANLTNAKLRETILSHTNLTKANLTNADLSDADLSEAFFETQFVEKNWFDEIETWKVIGREKIKKDYLIEEVGEKLILKRKTSQSN